MPFPYNLYDFKKNENMKSWKIYLYHKEVVVNKTNGINDLKD